MQWAYASIERHERQIEQLVNELNELGAEGWEAFATLSMKKGITADTVTVLLN